MVALTKLKYLRTEHDRTLRRFSTLQKSEVFITNSIVEESLYTNPSPIKRLTRSILSPSEPVPLVVVLQGNETLRRCRITTFLGIKVR